MSDEIYEHINFTGHHESIAQFDFLKERVIINGLSKGYAMTGWRLGYIAAPVELPKPAIRSRDSLPAVPMPLRKEQPLQALTGTMEPTQLMVKKIPGAATSRCNWLLKFPAFQARCHRAFLCFPDVKSYFRQKQTPCEWLFILLMTCVCTFLNTAHVSGGNG